VRAVAAAAAIALTTLVLGACAPPPPGDVSVIPGDGQLTVSFSPRVFDANSAGVRPTKGYYVRLSSGEFQKITFTTSSPTTITGLDNGRTYTVRVSTVDTGWHESDDSAPVDGTPRGAPGAVAGVSATPGNGSTVVAFTPGSDGGAPVTGYTVTATDGVHPPVTASGTSSPVAVTGLAPRTAYTVTVTATNVVGTGSPSAPAAVTTFGGPDAPGDVVVTPLDGAAQVAFDPPVDDGGSPVTGYTVVVGDGDPSHVFLPVSGASSPILVTGLANHVPHHFSVYASNAFGSGFMSSAVTATPIP
jgi:titin